MAQLNLPEVRGRINYNVPLAHLTWFGVGGPAGHIKRRTDGALESLENCVKVTLTDGETIQSICCGGGE